MNDEIAYKLLKLIEAKSQLTQREVAQKMSVSLGKANYCIKALIGKGYIKIQNFYSNKKKSKYIYFLTPQGLEEKTAVTYRFLQRKVEEYESIKAEIEILKNEAALTKKIRAPDSEQ